MKKVEIFGIKFNNLDLDEALQKIKSFLENRKQHYIVLPYSEFIIRAQQDKEFRKILNEADLCLCESRGLWFSLRFLGKELKKNIYGVDLILALSQKLKIQNKKIFLFGGKEKVVKKTGDKLGECIVGTEHGYQDLDKVVEKINKVKPDILLVALGSPKQEKWIYYNLKKMPSVKVAIGVGGAFDFISGYIKRAPKFMQDIGLEWLWRLIVQPHRFKRIYNGVIKLGCLILKEKISSHIHNS